MALSEEMNTKLECMQIKGVKQLIWDNIDKDIIENRLLGITGQTFTKNLEKFVNSQSRKVLIKLIEISPEVQAEMIDDAYEKYRYGLKPGFTLFWTKGHESGVVSEQKLETEIGNYLSDLKYDETDKYKKLQYIALDRFDDVYELAFTYLQRFNYINENGDFSYIYILKDCFVWVGIEKGFIAISNMPEILMKKMKAFFSNLYGTEITNITITQKLLNRVFDSENATKVTRQSLNPPENQLEKITLADPELSKKLDFLPEEYSQYDVTNTQYIEEIDGVMLGNVGVNCKKGKLYLSKNVSLTQFRNWSIKRISDIISYYQTTTDTTLEHISSINMFSVPSWPEMNKNATEMLNKIVLAIVSCKKRGEEFYPCTIDVYRMYQELQKYLQVRVSYICDECEELAIPSCNKCGNRTFKVSKRAPARLICDCGEIQENTYTLTCENGHISEFKNINEILRLVSQEEFTEKLTNIMRFYYPQYILNNKEYLVITANGIEIHSSPDYEKLKPSDIAGFLDITNHQLYNTREELQNILFSLKEKCTASSIEKCKECKNNTCDNVAQIGCLLRLFLRYEGFTPQPHQGHEFGDVSFLINHKNMNMTFLGIAKSGHTKVTKSSKIGREIIQQALDAMDDSRAEIIGIIYPDLLDDQLKYRLYHQAKLTNKRVVILDNEFMISLLDSFLVENNITIKS